MTTSAPTVVVVDPQTPGNVGTIARSMKNFGFSDLVLVDPPELDPEGEAYGFAGQAREDVLPNHSRATFEAVAETYHTIGFTAVTNEDATKHVRYPYTTPEELASDLSPVDADVALVFGREDSGLTNDELERMDRVCSIPANAEYPVLNLGQAATVTLYELRSLTVDEPQLPDRTQHHAPEPQIERLHDQFESLLASIDHPEPKRDKTGRMFRRLLGRTDPTEQEVITLLGVLRRASGYAIPPAQRDGDGTDTQEDGQASESN